MMNGINAEYCDTEGCCREAHEALKSGRCIVNQNLRR